MKQKLIYISISIIVLIAYTFTTMTKVVTESQDELNSKVFSKVKEDKDFNDFVSMQTDYYFLMEEFEENNFQFSFYHLVGKDKEQGILIITIPTNKINHAKDFEDKLDQTKILAINKNDNNAIIDTSLLDGAISYGYDEEKIGFMFFYSEIKESVLLEISYTDYDGTELLKHDLNFDLKDEDSFDSDFEKGLTIEEIKDLMNYKEKLKKALLSRVGIYLAVVVIVPFIFIYFKNLLNKKNKIESS